MTDFVIHSNPGSPFGRAVFAALEEKGATYRLAPVGPGQFRTADHLARHPFGKVPVMDHGDFRLYETQAILRYIDRVLADPPLTPRDPKAAGRMDQVMNVSDWYLFQGVGAVIGFQRVVLPRLLGGTPDEAKIAEAMPKAHAVFDELGRLLGGQAYFAGDAISLADLMVAPQLDFFFETPEWDALAGGHPNLVAWLKRMTDRPSLAATTWDRVAALAKAA